MSEVLTRQVMARAITEEMIANRQIEFVVADDTADRHGTVWDIDSWILEHYHRNNIVLYLHDSTTPDPDLVIGTGNVFVEGRQLIGRVTFESEELNPLADKVFRKVVAGTLKMASVGAIPHYARLGDVSKGEDEDLIYFSQNELVEFSIVPIGSQRNALKRSIESLEEIRTSLKKPESNEEKKVSRSVFERQLKINKQKFL